MTTQASPEKKNNQAPMWLSVLFVIIALGLMILIITGNTQKKTTIVVPKGFKIIQPQNAPPRLETPLN